MISIFGPVKKLLPKLIPYLRLLPFILILPAVDRVSDAQVEAKPQAVIEQTSHDFGDVFMSEEVSHLFRVRNLGNAPLELSDKKSLISLGQPQLRYAARYADSTSLPLRAAVIRAAPA